LFVNLKYFHLLCTSKCFYIQKKSQALIVKFFLNPSNMKNKAGKIIGFIIGMAGFLLLFKVIILDTTPPSDELAPGIVVIAAIVSGIVFAFAGNLLQNRMSRKKE